MKRSSGMSGVRTSLSRATSIAAMPCEASFRPVASPKASASAISFSSGRPRRSAAAGCCTNARRRMRRPPPGRIPVPRQRRPTPLPHVRMPGCRRRPAVRPGSPSRGAPPCVSGPGTARALRRPVRRTGPRHRRAVSPLQPCGSGRWCGFRVLRTVCRPSGRCRGLRPRHSFWKSPSARRRRDGSISVACRVCLCRTKVRKKCCGGCLSVGFRSAGFRNNFVSLLETSKNVTI